MNSLFPGEPSVVLVAFSFISTHRHSCSSLSRLVELPLCECLSRKWAKLTLKTEIYRWLLKAERDSIQLRVSFRTVLLGLARAKLRWWDFLLAAFPLSFTWPRFGITLTALTHLPGSLTQSSKTELHGLRQVGYGLVGNVISVTLLQGSTAQSHFAVSVMIKKDDFNLHEHLKPRNSCYPAHL